MQRDGIGRGHDLQRHSDGLMCSHVVTDHLGPVDVIKPLLSRFLAC